MPLEAAGRAAEAGGGAEGKLWRAGRIGRWRPAYGIIREPRHIEQRL
ncbi:hypothetical protein [Methylobacterium sp. WL103]|nr:hypothetical protein [Methylobacterium sp. WL103]